MPTTSPNPEAEHKRFWSVKLTRPIDDPFWNKHRPGDRWNCKCSLEATDEPPTDIPDDADDEKLYMYKKRHQKFEAFLGRFKPPLFT